jgi:mycothione reductase
MPFISVSNTNTFDLIVIGSGSGLDVANAAYQDSLKVAVIEKDKMGRKCLNRGCVPSKMLMHSTDSHSCNLITHF